jgi:predicted transcriptional regulator
VDTVLSTDNDLAQLAADISIDDIPFFFQTGLQVRDVMTKGHVVASCQESMTSVVKMLESSHAPFVAIEDCGQIIGIITEREVVATIAARGLDLRMTESGDAMVTLGRGLAPECPLVEASRILRAQGRRWVPIRSGQDFISVLTQEDLTRAATLLPELGPVREFMAKSLVKIDAMASLTDAATVMSEHRLSCVVAMHQDKAVGILTERDLLHQAARVDAAAENRTVADVMTFPIITVSADCSLSEARAIMARHHIRRLVILEGGRPHGIITQTDIVSSLHRKLEEDARRRWHRLDRSPNPVFAVDLDGNITYANHAYLSLLGVERFEHIAGHALLPPEMWANPADRTPVLATLESQDIQAQEARLKTRCGEIVRVVLFSSLNKNFRGEVIGKQGILWNLSTGHECA